MHATVRVKPRGAGKTLFPRRGPQRYLAAREVALGSRAPSAGRGAHKGAVCAPHKGADEAGKTRKQAGVMRTVSRWVGSSSARAAVAACMGCRSARSVRLGFQCRELDVHFFLQVYLQCICGEHLSTGLDSMRLCEVISGALKDAIRVWKHCVQVSVTPVNANLNELPLPCKLGLPWGA